ncbi:LysR family transcriptional regulator [Lelliottia nimipressuralis]|uniref:LysR family transcriptional regulator n=1 Tax=Lelliottia nimipressuralis TaxID=69220 RepID=UPI003B25E9A9
MSALKPGKAEIERLRIFDRVMNTQNLSHAATSLNISYSTVSMAIRKLRILYNDVLFIQDGKTMVPTAFAIMLHSEIQGWLQNTQPNNIPSDEAPDNNFFVFACEPHIAAIITPLAYLSMHDMATLPLAHTTLPSTAQSKTDLLLNNEVDVILDYAPLQHDAIFSKRLFNEDYVIVCSNDHPRLLQSITHKEFCQEKHAVQKLASGSENQRVSDNPYCVVFSSNYFLDLLAIVEVSEFICVVPLNIYLKLHVAFNIKSLSYNFKLNVKNTSLYINYLKDASRSPEKTSLLKKMEKMH